jgi:hypothetical protein
VLSFVVLKTPLSEIPVGHDVSSLPPNLVAQWHTNRKNASIAILFAKEKPESAGGVYRYCHLNEK